MKGSTKMTRILENYEPKRACFHFENISAIPRGSGNEKGIADYLVSFAEQNGLWYHRDGINCVLIKKPASKGYEDHAPVILQGHTDMVCEKNLDTVHDFEKDGLKLKVKDGWLEAEGTTLGADDGVAVAIMLAILEDKSAAHPPLECLFTVMEETGMDGALDFDYSLLEGRTMINLDSEDLDCATVSCAGGATTTMTVNCDTSTRKNKLLKVTLKGLAGGHSGVEINKGRANANILMARLLSALYDKRPFNLVSINGGNKTNAIPRECEAVIAVFDPEDSKETLLEAAKVVSNELCDEDAGFKLHINKANGSDFVMTYKDTSRVLRAICLLPNGVMAFSRDIKGLVETSSNLGIVRTDGQAVRLITMERSSVDSKLDYVMKQFDMLGRCVDATVEHSERHPGWEYAREGRIRDVYFESFKKLFGYEPKFEAIHAGLECGIIGRSLGKVDTVSFGPKVVDIHTPDEKLDLKSFKDGYELVLEMLKKL